MKHPVTHSLLIAGSIAIMASAATAAPWGGHGKGCEQSDERIERIERMTDRLDLSDDQQAQIRTIFDEQRQQRRTQRQAMRERIDAVLTPEQLALRDQHMDERQTRRLDRMAERLELTAEQQDAMAALLQEKRADPNLDPGQMRVRMAEILDEAQLARLDDMRHRHGGGRF